MAIVHYQAVQDGKSVGPLTTRNYRVPKRPEVLSKWWKEAQRSLKPRLDGIAEPSAATTDLNFIRWETPTFTVTIDRTRSTL